jgi:hypothetical protein
VLLKKSLEKLTDIIKERALARKKLENEYGKECKNDHLYNFFTVFGWIFKYENTTSNISTCGDARELS